MPKIRFRFDDVEQALNVSSAPDGCEIHNHNRFG